MADKVTFVEVVTDEALVERIEILKEEGYKDTEKVMEVPINKVDFTCGETRCIFSSKVHKMFTVVETGETLLPGFHVKEGTF